jgi:hypothetical protein
MKKFVITEEEKKWIKLLYENETAKSSSMTPLLRRWDLFSKTYDGEFEFSAICHFKKDDDFDGYLNHVTKGISKSMFLYDVGMEGSTNEDLFRYVNIISDAIKDNYKDDIKKQYKKKHC